MQGLNKLDGLFDMLHEAPQERAEHACQKFRKQVDRDSNVAESGPQRYFLLMNLREHIDPRWPITHRM
jgi:hypothetical protein